MYSLYFYMLKGLASMLAYTISFFFVLKINGYCCGIQGLWISFQFTSFVHFNTQIVRINSIQGKEEVKANENTRNSVQTYNVI